MKNVFLKEVNRPGVGRVAIFTDREVVVKPTQTYKNCSKLINAIFREARIKHRRGRVKAKLKPIDYVV